DARQAPCADRPPRSPHQKASGAPSGRARHPRSCGQYGELALDAPCWGKQRRFAMTAPQIDENTRTELEAAAFRRLVQHLRERTDVQNIDMMNLAGFCRNCL